MPNVYTLWATRKSEPRGFPELLVAWDEYMRDENLEGFNANCRDALDAMASDLNEFRYMTLWVSDSDIERAFKPPVVSADVIPD